jgi:hypothetical protein
MEGAQKNLEGGEIPKVSKTQEQKQYEVYRSDHLVLKATEEALEKFGEMDPEMQRAWVQSKARIKKPKEPIADGIWDEETRQILGSVAEG